MSFARSGAALVVPSYQETTLAVRVLPSREVRKIPLKDKLVVAALNAAGDTAAAVSRRGEVLFYDSRDGAELASLQGAAEPRAVHFCDRDQSLVLIGTGGLEVFTIKPARRVLQDVVEGQISAHAVDSQFAAVGTSTGQLVLWDLARRMRIGTFRSEAMVLAVDLSAPLRRVLAADKAGGITVLTWSM
jgi:hypothetical protein